MHVGVVPHYRPCLLVKCHCNTGADERIVASLVLPVQRCHYIRHVCWTDATLRYACLYSATLLAVYAGYNYSDTGSCSHGFVKLVGYHPRRHLEYIKILNDAWISSLGCYTDNVCNLKISKISILHANPWSLPVSGKTFSFIFCNKLPSWRPSCPHLILFFIWYM